VYTVGSVRPSEWAPAEQDIPQRPR